MRLLINPQAQSCAISKSAQETAKVVGTSRA